VSCTAVRVHVYECLCFSLSLCAFWEHVGTLSPARRRYFYDTIDVRMRSPKIV
jgi:hypothetical protein